MIAALKILFDVAAFRLKRLEMANVFASLSISLALGLRWYDAAYRVVFALLLNVLAVLTNDCYDVEQDLASPDKDRAKTLFLKQHLRQAVVAQIVLAACLVGAGLAWSRGLVAALVLGAGNCWIYSARLKRMPYLDVVSIGLWGALMPMCGFPLDSLLGWCLVGELALLSACFEVLQILRDREEDARCGIRTTAVHLGAGRTTLLLRGLLVAAAVYAALVLHRWVGFPILLAALLPVPAGEAARVWDRVRLITGVAWLALIAWVWWRGGTDGWLVAVDADSTIDALEWIR